MATITLQIIGDTKGAVKGVQGVTASLEGLDRVAASAVKTVGGVVAGFVSLQALASVMRTVFDNTLDAEKSSAQLNAALKSTGLAAGYTRTELDKMAKSMEAATGIEDDMVTSAQAMLIKFNSVSKDVFPRVMQVSADLAASLGGDLTSAVQMVGYALANPTMGMRSLRQAGIVLTESQREIIKELVKTGKEAEAQSLILELLEKRTKGAAAAMRDTFGGALGALRVAIGNLLEGDTEGLGGLKKAVNEVIELLSSPEVKRGFAEAIKVMLSALPPLIKGIGLVISGLAAIGPHLETIASLMGTGIKIGLTYLAGYFTMFVALPALYGAVTTAVWGLTAALAAQNVSFMESLKSMGLIRAMAGTVFAAWAGWEIGTKLRDEFDGVKVLGDGMVQALLISWERLKQGTSIVWEGIKAAAVGTLNLIAETLARTVALFASGIEFMDVSGLSAKAVAGMREFAASIKPTKSAAEGLKIAVANINKETDENIAKIKEHTTVSIAAYEATQAQEEATDKLAGTIEIIVPEIDEFGGGLERTKEQMKELQQATTQLQGILRNQAKTLGDESTKAALTFAESMLGIYEIEQKLVELGALDAATVQALNFAREQALKIYHDTITAISEQLTVSEELLKGLDEEIELLKLGNEERETEVLVRRAIADAIADGTPLTEQETQALREQVATRLSIINALELQREAEEQWVQNLTAVGQEAGDIFADFFTSVSTGYESMNEGFESLGENLLNMSRRIVQQMISEFLRLRVINPMLNNLLGAGLQAGTSMGAAGGSTNWAAQMGGAGGVGGAGGIASLFGGGASGALNGSARASYGVLNTATGRAGSGFGMYSSGIGAAAGVLGGAYGLYQAYQNDDPLSGAMAGAQIGMVFGPWGALVGAALGALVASLNDTTRRITVIGKDMVGTAGYRNLAPGSTYASDLGGFTFASIDNVNSEERDAIAAPIQEFDNQMAVLLADYRDAVTTALANWKLELEEDEITAEGILNSRFEAMLAALPDEISALVPPMEDLADRAQRLGDVIALQGEVAAGNAFYTSLTDVVTLLDELADAGESLGETYARVNESVNLLEDAVAQAGVTLNLSRDAFIRFATDITDAAGGIDRARELWGAYMSYFVDGNKLMEGMIAQAREAATQELGEVGLGAGTTMEQFRTLFEEALPNLSAEAIVEWLEAAEALGYVIDMQDEYNAVLHEARGNYANFIEGLTEELGRPGIRAALIQITAWEQGAIRSANQLARAAGLQGASENTLSLIHQVAARRASEAIAALRAATQDLVEQFNNGLPGAVADWTNGTIDAIGQVAQADADMREAQLRNAQAITDYLDSLLLDNNLTTLTPEQQLAEARRQLIQTFNAARGGDTEAGGRLPQMAEQFLTLLRSFESSGDNYTAGFDWVRDMLSQVAGMPIAPGGGPVVGGVVGSGEPVLTPEQMAQDRLTLAQSLAEHLAALAEAIGQPIFELASDLGVSMNELVEGLGVNLSSLTVDTADRLADISNTLGVELVDLASSVGVDLGSLADEQSLLNDALESRITALPDEQRDLLEPLFRAVEDATTKADANAALELLNDAVNELAPGIRNELAPFLAGVDPVGPLADLDFLSEISDQQGEIIISQDKTTASVDNMNAENKAGQETIIARLESIAAKMDHANGLTQQLVDYEYARR